MRTLWKHNFPNLQKKDDYSRLIFECDKCGNTTELNITQPELSIDWHINNGKESDGISSFNL